MTHPLLTRFKNIDNKMLTLLIFPLICIVFIQLHVNQHSSQSMATLLLMFSPLCFFYSDSKKIFEYDYIKTLFALIIGYCIYNFLILTQHSFNQLSLATYRALFFWLLLPFTLIFLVNKKPSMQTISIIFSLAAILSLYPIVTDFIHNDQRGNSSGHPIFWGNISLCSAMISFALRKSLNNRHLQLLSYLGLICGLTASFWSLTRGGWITIPLSIVCLYLCKSITKKHIIISASFLVLVVSIIPSINERIAHTFKSINISWQDLSIDFDHSTQARFDMWNTSITLIKQNPITGSGFSAYRDGIKEMKSKGVELDRISYYDMPHNEYMNILTSGGIISLIFLIAIIAILLRIFSQFQPKSPFKVAGYLLVIQFLVFSISEIFFSTKLTITYFCIASALIIYAGFSEKKQHEH